MNYRSIFNWAASAVLLSSTSHAQVVTFFDDFDDNIVTGWTFLDRNGEEEIANAEWVEANERLEQLTPNYDFSAGPNGRPSLGTIALAPTQAGGQYEISVIFTSLEPDNNFQDQSIIFGYVDEDNFLIVETFADTNTITLFQVVEGNRTVIGADVQSITFNHESTLVTLRHDAVDGIVTVTYGDDEPLEYTDPDLIFEDERSVGVGSNNDAFTIDEFTITSGFPVETEFVLEITEFVLNSVAGSASVTWSSEIGTEYALERSTDLMMWQDIGVVVAEAISTTLVDPAASAESFFYRVVETEEIPEEEIPEEEIPEEEIPAE